MAESNYEKLMNKPISEIVKPGWMTVYDGNNSNYTFLNKVLEKQHPLKRTSAFETLDIYPDKSEIKC